MTHMKTNTDEKQGQNAIFALNGASLSVVVDVMHKTKANWDRLLKFDQKFNILILYGIYHV